MNEFENMNDCDIELFVELTTSGHYNNQIRQNNC